MSNSTGSQDISMLIIEPDHVEIPKMQPTESNSNSFSINDYTYHRHSAPKDIIYYRCSDKRCPARVHFNPLTKIFSLKNQHLNAKVHKVPCSQKIITSDELINFPNLPMRGPLIISKEHIPLELQCDEEFITPHKRPHSDNLIDPNPDKHYLLQFKVLDSQRFDMFSKDLVNNCLATKAFCYSRGKRFTGQRYEKVEEKVIEVYTSTHFMGKVLLHIINYFGRGVEVLFFQKDN